MSKKNFFNTKRYVHQLLFIHINVLSLSFLNYAHLIFFIHSFLIYQSTI